MNESDEARRDNAKLQKNSGRGWRQKGDAILSRFLIDYKDASKSFNLNQRVWAKVCTDAMSEGLDPALKITLGAEDPVRLWIVPDRAFKEMLASWRELNEKDVV